MHYILLWVISLLTGLSASQIKWISIIHTLPRMTLKLQYDHIISSVSFKDFLSTKDKVWTVIIWLTKLSVASVCSSHQAQSHHFLPPPPLWSSCTSDLMTLERTDFRDALDLVSNQALTCQIFGGLLKTFLGSILSSLWWM